MAVNKMEDLLKWMAIKPRTFGWGALMAYDRFKTNTLIKQEYINKFSNGDYMPPASGPVPTTDATWGYFYDQILDAPQISFENKNNDMEGQVHVTQSVMGGSSIELDGIGGKRLIKVTSIDALDGPKLKMNARIREVKGEVDGALGTVELDLGSNENTDPDNPWELTFANSQHERRKGGEFFKKLYKGTDHKKRTFTLGKIQISKDDILKPKSFRLLTQPAPGAQSKASGNYGDGALLLFIQLEGDEFTGTLPDKNSDLRYLIPDDVPGQYDCVTLISNEAFMREILVRGAKHLCNTDVNFLNEVKENGLIKGLVSKNGFVTQPFHVSTYYFVENGYTVYFNLNERYLQMGSSTPFSISLDQAGGERLSLSIKWAGRAERTFTSLHHTPSPTRHQHSAWLNWDYQAKWELEVDFVSQSVSIVPYGEHKVVVSLDPREITHPAISSRFGEISKFYNTEANRFMSVEFRNMFFKAPNMGFFVLNTLLFNSNEAVQLKTARLPGDLAFFGKISPGQTSFTVNPMQPLMGQGKTQFFTTDSDRTDLEWTVENIPGETGNVGSITLDDKGGCTYTAPRDAEFVGTFKRVKLIATVPGTDITSSALVTVLAHDISISPWIQICNYGEKRKLSAGTLGAGILDWSVKVPGYGNVTSSPDEEGKVTYTAGPLDETRTFHVEEIVVKNRLTQSSKSSYVLVLTQALTSVTVSVESESSYPQGKAQLLGRVGTGAANKNFEWRLLAGSGSIDATGLFTAGTGEYPFALISARREIPDFGVFEGFIILTNPLFSLPDKPVL